MSDQRAHEIWKQICHVLDEKLQYGFLEQAKSVVDVKLEGDEFTLFVSGDDALRFFSAEVNQQRLLIVSRPIASIQRFHVQKNESSPFI